METKTKWIIGIGSAVVLGITAYATRKKWMPKKAESETEKPKEEDDSSSKSMGEKTDSSDKIKVVHFRTPTKKILSDFKVSETSKKITSEDLAKLFSAFTIAKSKADSIRIGGAMKNEATRKQNEAWTAYDKAKTIYDYQNVSSFDGYSGKLNELSNNNLIEL